VRGCSAQVERPQHAKPQPNNHTLNPPTPHLPQGLLPHGAAAGALHRRGAGDGGGGGRAGGGHALGVDRLQHERRRWGCLGGGEAFVWAATGRL